MDLFVVVQPVGHFLDVGRHILNVVHVAGAALGAATLGDCAPTTVGDDFCETFGALGAHASFSPPQTLFFAGVDFGDVRRACAAIVDSADAILIMHDAGNVVGRSVEIGEFSATGGLGHSPFGGLIVVEPAGVVNQMTQHVGRPTGRRAVNGMDTAERAAGDDFFDFLIMRAVTVLMADDGFGAGFVEELFDSETFGARHGDGFFEGDQFSAGFDSDFHEVDAQVRQGAKAIEVGLGFVGQRGGVGVDFRIAELGRSGFETCLIDVTNAYDFETRVGVKRAARGASRVCPFLLPLLDIGS